MQCIFFTVQLNENCLKYLDTIIITKLLQDTEKGLSGLGSLRSLWDLFGEIFAELRLDLSCP